MRRSEDGIFERRSSGSKKRHFSRNAIFCFLITLVFVPSCAKKMEHTGNISSLAFSPDGRWLASGSEYFGIEKDFIKIWDVGAGKKTMCLQGHSNGVTTVDFSPDGKILASGGRDGLIKLWNVDPGTIIKTLQGHAHGVASVKFSPDGQSLVSGGSEALAEGAETIKLWDVNVGNKIEAFWAHNGNVYTLAFAQDGQGIASGGEGRNVYYWNLKSLKIMKSLRINNSGGVTSVAFSPDGNMIASASGRRIKISRLKTHKLEEMVPRSIPFCREYFQKDTLYLKNRRWFRFQGDENQILVNENNHLELRFNQKFWIASYYLLPPYSSNSVLDLEITAKADGQQSRIYLFDNNSNTLIFDTRLFPSTDFEKYRFRVRMPETKGHVIMLYFHQSDYEKTGGSLIIKKMKINRLISRWQP